MEWGGKVDNLVGCCHTLIKGHLKINLEFRVTRPSTGKAQNWIFYIKIRSNSSKLDFVD